MELDHTATADVIAEKYHFVAQFPLDIGGCAGAFAWLHGHGPSYDHGRPFPSFAYNPDKESWMMWELDNGWTTKRSVIPEMSTIMAALCALHATMSTADTDREYQRYRQKYLGGAVDKAIKYAQAIMTVESWDGVPTTIGLPSGECLFVQDKNPDSPVSQIDQIPGDYLTKRMGAGCGVRLPHKASRLWSDFIVALTGGDILVEHALQVWTAAALLPGNPHHKAHILYGDGGTGKSVFLKTIQAAMGDYAGSGRSSVFTSEKDTHPAELLPFIDKRLVVLPELPKGALRSDLLKTVTGGDSISVRGMRQNPRTATPEATLMFSANELPSIRMVDNAIKRRLMIWPFDHQPVKVDAQLIAKLATPEHLGNVVQWLITGLEKYVRILDAGNEMPIPDAVANATAEYFDEVDTIAQWAEACVDLEGETLAATLYQSYRAWCETASRKSLSERSFGLWLSRHYTKRRIGAGNLYPVRVV